MKKLIILERCIGRHDNELGCPYIHSERTPGAGCATDYYCTKTKTRRLIAGYVEWSRDLPPDGTFPDWCPLYDLEPGMYTEKT